MTWPDVTPSVRQQIANGIVAELEAIEAVRGASYEFPTLERTRQLELPHAFVYPLPESFIDDEDQATNMVHSHFQLGVEIIYRHSAADIQTLLVVGERLLADTQKRIHEYQEDPARAWQGILTERQNDLQPLPLDDAPYGVVVFVLEATHYRARRDPDTQDVAD